MAAGFFDSGSLANHNHSTVPGDGGQLSNPTVTGIVTVTGLPANAGDLSPFSTSLLLSLAGISG